MKSIITSPYKLPDSFIAVGDMLNDIDTSMDDVASAIEEMKINGMSKALYTFALYKNLRTEISYKGLDKKQWLMRSDLFEDYVESLLRIEDSIVITDELTGNIRIKRMNKVTKSINRGC